ncbi:MAG: dienelactone hydrolase family protein, partial [Balneolaceae bacterium]|nr:dienelactone hydrolase family protein [Balneolaceae bacterium]
VIYFPGSAALFRTNSQNFSEYYEFPVFLSFLVNNGRAVFFPVYKGTFERGVDMDVMPILSNGTNAYTDYLIQVVKDYRRSLDYLETRNDIDDQKFAFYGMSWGGWMGTIIPAVEERLKANILLAGGMFSQGQPEAEQINYVTRVDIPTLMLNGRYDSTRPYDTSIKPLFDLLGTPEEQKKLVVYDTDHIPPKVEYIKEILDWLDLHLGAVN